MVNSNTPNSLTLEDKMFDAMSSARSALIAARDSGIEAAAQAYYIYRNTASPAGKIWFDAQVAEANKAVDEHNEAVQKRQDDVKMFKDNKLSPEHEYFSKDKAIAAAAKARLDADTVIDNKKLWDAEKQMKVEAKTGASPFTVLIKLVFELRRSKEASLISKYAKVLEYLEAELGGKPFNGVSEAIKLIKDVGGVEEAYAIQSGRRSSESMAEAKDREIIDKAIANLAQAAAKAAPPRGIAAVKTTIAHGGFVILLGRDVGGSVEVVGDISLDKTEVANLVSRFRDDQHMPIHPSSEFVARVLALGEIIEEAKSSQPDGADKKSDKQESKRNLCLRSDAKGAPQVVFSARNADASAVVYATPKHETVKLGNVNGLLELDHKDHGDMRKRLKKEAVRRLCSIVGDENPKTAAGKDATSKLAWILGNEALIAADRDNGQRTYYWRDISKGTSKPLDVSNFQPQIALTLTMGNVKELYEGSVNEYKSDHDPKKSIRSGVLAFEDKQLTLKIEGKDDHVVPTACSVSDPCELNVRLKDLKNLILALVQQHTNCFTVQVDTGGLLAVSWSDNLGDYSVFMPSCKSDARLESRRVEPMRSLVGPVISLSLPANDEAVNGQAA